MTSDKELTWFCLTTGRTSNCRSSTRNISDWTILCNRQRETAYVAVTWSEARNSVCGGHMVGRAVCGGRQHELARRRALPKISALLAGFSDYQRELCSQKEKNCVVQAQSENGGLGSLRKVAGKSL